MRCVSTEHRVGGSGSILPRKIWNFALQEMQSSVKSQFILTFLGAQINMKSSRLGYCMHTSYTNRGGSLNVWGRSWGVWGGSFPPPPTLDRTLLDYE